MGNVFICGDKQYEIINYNGDYLLDSFNIINNSGRTLMRRSAVNGNPYGRFYIKGKEDNFNIYSLSGIMTYGPATISNEKKILFNSNNQNGIQFSIEQSNISEYYYVFTKINNQKYYLSSVYPSGQISKTDAISLLFYVVQLTSDKELTTTITSLIDIDKTKNGFLWKFKCVDDSGLGQFKDSLNRPYDSLWSSMGIEPIENIGIYSTISLSIILLLIIAMIFKSKKSKRYDDDDDNN